MALVEISLESAESAQAAEQGGADRIELCSALSEGGITPSLGLVRSVRAACSVPMFVIVRPRAGDFLYTDQEFRTMKEDVRVLAQEGIEGLVFGLLTAAGHIDVRRTRELVAESGNLQTTFHRAFDMAADLDQALEDVIACGVQRVLTSGGAQSAAEGSDKLRSLIMRANGRITVLVGGGVRPENVGDLKAHTGATEFHSSMRHVVPSPMVHRKYDLNFGSSRDEFTRLEVSVEAVKQLVAAASSRLPKAAQGQTPDSLC